MPRGSRSTQRASLNIADNDFEADKELARLHRIGAFTVDCRDGLG